MAVPRTYAPRARYALRALLEPLGLEPAYGGRPAIVYGDPGPDDGRALRLACAASAASLLAGKPRPYAPSGASTFAWEGASWPALFVDGNGEPDLVASTFYFLSGWHEVAVSVRDEHGRVPFEATLPGVLDEADRPVVDVYRAMLGAKLERAGIEVKPRTWNGRTWAVCPTHDVDYLRKGRPGIWYREMVQELLQNRRGISWPRRVDRFTAFVRQIASGDPYREALSRMIREVAGRGGTATYFVKAGGGDPHDVPYALTGSFVHRWLAELSDVGFEVGLHPSYRSLDEPDLLGRERDRLRAAASTELRSIRQHYLRYDPQTTPGRHEDAGFVIDSTIGYAGRPGFRRGTCLPFRLYDLEKDRPLDVWEMPLTIMESALFHRQGMSVDEAVEATRGLMDTCRRFGGACIALWHNTLWDELDFPGWGEHFTRTLDLAVEGGALVTSLENGLKTWGSVTS